MAAVASGGYFLWPWISRGAGGGNEVGPMAAVQLINRKNAVVLDVREQGEFNGGFKQACSDRVRKWRAVTCCTREIAETGI